MFPPLPTCLLALLKTKGLSPQGAGIFRPRGSARKRQGRCGVRRNSATLRGMAAQRAEWEWLSAFPR